MTITARPIKLYGLERTDAAMLMKGDSLCAILSRLPEDYGTPRLWFVEWSTDHEGSFDEGFAILEAACVAFEAAND